MQNEPGTQSTIPDHQDFPTDQRHAPTWPLASAQGDPSRGTNPQLIPYYPAPSGPAITTRRRGIPWYVWVVGVCLGLLAVGILAVTVVLGLAAGMALHATTTNHSGGGPGIGAPGVGAPGAPVQTSALSKSFPVTGTPTLHITDPAGNITVQPGSGSTVAMQATILVQGNPVQNGQDGINVTSTQEGNTIDITVTMAQDTNPFNGNRQVNIDVTVPQQTNMQVRLNAGNITMHGITGQLTTQVDAGNIDVQGGTLSDGSQVQSSVGNVTYQGALASGAKVSIGANTGSVTVTLPANTATSINASTAVGSIGVSGWDLSPSTVNTTGQALSGTLGSSANGSLSVKVNTGSITINQG